LVIYKIRSFPKSADTNNDFIKKPRNCDGKETLFLMSIKFAKLMRSALEKCRKRKNKEKGRVIFTKRKKNWKGAERYDL